MGYSIKTSSYGTLPLNSAFAIAAEKAKFNTLRCVNAGIC